MVIVTGCGYLALFVRRPAQKRLLAAGCGILAGNIALGALLLALPAGETDTVRAAVVQGNIGTSEKWESGRAAEILALYASLAEQAAQAGAELILLPETAVPVYFEEGGVLHQAYARIAAEYGCTQFAAGEDSAVLPLCGIETGALVCYDSIFPPLSADSVKNGAQMLAVVTNDSWFGNSAALSQQMAQSVLRAVENGVCVVRAANTGISCIVGPKGELRAQTEPDTAAVAYADVGAAPRRTLYSYVGDAVLYLAFAFVLMCLLWAYIEKRTEKKHDRNQTAQQTGV